MEGVLRVRAAGDMGALTVRVLRAAVTAPRTWWRAAVVEFATHARRLVVPLVVSISAYTIGYAVFVALALLDAIGATDRQPGAIFVFMNRELAVWVSSMVFAGVAGSAVCADLGARKIREELDAMAVLGVDDVRALVVPRVLALTALGPVVGLVGLFAASLASYLVAPGLGGFSHAVFMDSLTRSILVADLASFLLKLVVVGLFVGVVSCYKGRTASGGSAGVGRAVNETVVLCFFGIWLLNSIWNLAYLSAFPDSSVLRG